MFLRNCGSILRLHSRSFEAFGTLVPTIEGINLEIFLLVMDVSGIGWTTPSTLEIICLSCWSCLAIIGLIPASRSIELVLLLKKLLVFMLLGVLKVSSRSLAIEVWMIGISLSVRAEMDVGVVDSGCFPRDTAFVEIQDH